MKKPDSKELRLLRREPEPVVPPPPPEVDAAESRWDPWLLALARVVAAEAEDEKPLPN
jgi:hypothetical protein